MITRSGLSLGDATGHLVLIEFARWTAAGTFLVAGAAQYLTWRSTRDPEMLRGGLLLLTLGVLLPARTLYLLWLAPTGDNPDYVALARSATFVAAFLVFTIVTGGAPTGSWPRQAAARCLFLLGAELAVGVGVVRTLSAGGAAKAGEVALACAWLYLTWKFAFRRAAAKDIRTAAFAIMGVGEVLRLVALFGPTALFDVCTVFDLLAAATIAAAGVTRLRSAWRADERQVRGLADRLSCVEAELRAMRDLEQQRLHDVRSTVAGVMGASELLTRRPPTATPEDDAKLRWLMRSELGRLESLLDIGAPQTGAFVLSDVLAPVIAAHRASGLSVDSEIEPITMAGPPHLLATVVDNLLRNAKVHAAGSNARVTARPEGEHVVLTVEDGGPGISAGERAKVFGRGVRGSGVTAVGSGLGLYNAARTVAQIGGALELGESPLGGLCVRLTLPTGLSDDVAPAAATTAEGLS